MRRKRSEQVADHWHAMLAHRVELQGRAAISFGKAGGDLEFEIDGFGDGRQFAGVVEARETRASLAEKLPLSAVIASSHVGQRSCT